jgi:hypothetical protein
MLKLMFSSGTFMVRPFGRVMVASAKLLRARVHSRRTMPAPQLLTGSAAIICEKEFLMVTGQIHGKH